MRLGAWRDEEPTSVPDGRDIEAYLAVPGIYDSVEIVLADFPYIDLIRTAPDLTSGSVKVITRVRNGQEATMLSLAAVITEDGESIERGAASCEPVALAAGEIRDVELDITIDDAQQWSPESPFLYSLDVATGADTKSTRFGMRTFTFDKSANAAVLNGSAYPMRGSASALFRFFEDPDRSNRPWDREWVRKLHRQFKAMHWNTIRYAIGFPPELWYEIADEEGLLVIDEFPLFYIYLADDAPAVAAARAIDPNVSSRGLQSITAADAPTSAPNRVSWPAPLTADAMEAEYREWIEERGNHASVVMFTSNCEGRTPETGKLIERLRKIDPQRRPWGDGWNSPQSDSDPFIGHWYLQWNASMRGEPTGLTMLSGMRKSIIGYPLGAAPDELLPHLRTAGKDFDGVPVNYGGNAVLLEEYGWLWLTRDGRPTRLTGPIYEAMEGWPVATADERRYTRARLTAAETEFFRCNRALAGVLMFCALTSSHDEVSTADAFTDLDSLDYEPHFRNYVGDAFSPVAAMVDLWDRSIASGVLHEIPVAVINDLPETWKGELVLQVLEASTQAVIMDQRRSLSVASMGQSRIHFGLTAPIPDGEHQIVAQLTDGQGYSVRSIRDVRVVPLESQGVTA